MTDTKPAPYDPSCKRYATDIPEYDDFIRAQEADALYIPLESVRDIVVTPEMRAAYVEQEEGTYNPKNGHFLCDKCYIKAGMPSAPNGWRCP